MTTDFEADVAARKPRLEELQKDLAAKGARYINVHMPEVNGVFRSKTAPFKLAYSGDALNAILYCVAHSDGAPTATPVFPGPISNDDNGYPNIMALPDPATVRQHGWRPRFASVILNSFLLDGSRCPLDPRAILKAQEDRARKLGYEPRFAIEYEFGIFHADHDLMRAGRYRELKPWGHSYINYDLVRGGDYQSFVAEFIDRMASIDVEVASMVTEYGYGMYEFALAPKPALQAADDAMRAKLHLRELCAERGLVATFMTRFQPPVAKAPAAAIIIRASGVMAATLLLPGRACCRNRLSITSRGSWHIFQKAICSFVRPLIPIAASSAAPGRLKMCRGAMRTGRQPSVPLQRPPTKPRGSSTGSPERTSIPISALQQCWRRGSTESRAACRSNPQHPATPQPSDGHRSLARSGSRSKPSAHLISSRTSSAPSSNHTI